MLRVARSVALPLLACATFIAACGSSSGEIAASPQSGLPAGVLTIGAAGGQRALSVEIAETDTQRHLGLMWREGLPPDSGMVFLFPGPTQEGFWMKNTRIPLSIAFWDATGHIVDILDMRPCEADPCPYYTPSKPYVAAVEAGLGYFEENGIAVGDPVELTR